MTTQPQDPEKSPRARPGADIEQTAVSPAVEYRLFEPAYYESKMRAYQKIGQLI
jgi:hypothetical protein